MPAHEELPAPPPPSAEWSRPNPNDKSTALGRLCWVRREVATHVINLLRAQLGEGDKGLVPEDEANAAVARFKEMLPTVSGELGSDDGLSGELKAYRNRLIQAAAEAERVLRDVPARSSRGDRSHAFRRLGAEQGVLDFSRFPGAAEFAAAAEADRSSCREL